MKNIRQRIRLAEGATRTARHRMTATQRILRQAVRRKAISPETLLSAFATGFVTARSTRVCRAGPNISKYLHQLARMGMLGIASLGYEALMSALRSRRARLPAK